MNASCCLISHLDPNRGQAIRAWCALEGLWTSSIIGNKLFFHWEKCIYAKASFDRKCSARHRFLLKGSSFKNTVPKYSFFACKTPHAHVQQDLCFLQGFKELTPVEVSCLPNLTGAGGTREMLWQVTVPVLGTALKKWWEFCWLYISNQMNDNHSWSASGKRGWMS